MEPYGPSRDGFWRPSTIAAGIVLLLVLIAGGVLLAVSGGGSTHHGATRPPSPVTAAPATSAPTSPATTRVPAAEHGCSLHDGDQTIPEMTPQGITWQLYQTVALPSSPSYGPQVVDGDIAKCYAHNPIGALIAATQISARLVLAPSTDVATEQAVAGPGRSLFIQQDKAALGSTTSNQPGGFDQFAGFKFVTYSPAVAVIEFATKSDSGGLQASTVTVDWETSDWKIALQPDGDTTPNVLPLTSLVGYSIWAGV